jgi:PTS system nitrogen regulatory IIA component
MITADVAIAGLSVASKKQAFHVLAEAVAGLCHGDADEIFTAFMDRERLGPTGIGGGVAIPHIKIPAAKKLYGLLARVEKPIADYGAVDDAPVDIIYALVAPEDSRMTLHLKALAHMARFLKETRTREALRAAPDGTALVSVLNEWIGKQAA